jgi:hypothetical protein
MDKVNAIHTPVYLRLIYTYTMYTIMEGIYICYAEQQYIWPYSADGSHLQLDIFKSQLPASVASLQDDPYRSLAAILRKAGGYTKVRR